VRVVGGPGSLFRSASFVVEARFRAIFGWDKSDRGMESAGFRGRTPIEMLDSIQLGST